MALISLMQESIPDHTFHAFVMSFFSYSRMDSQPLCAFYEIHTLEYRLVVCGMSFSWVSLIIFQGYFSAFPRVLPHVWSGWLPSLPSTWLLLLLLYFREGAVVFSAKGRHSNPLRTQRKCTSDCDLSLPTLDGHALIPHGTPETQLQLKQNFNTWE